MRVIVYCSGFIVIVFLYSTYFIVSPSVFRPGQPYKLRVTLSSSVNAPVNIDCAIIIMNTKQKLMIASQSGVFNPGEWVHTA